MDSNDDSFESNSDEYNVQQRALDVQISEDFDPNSVPQTGEEYIQHVIYERINKCKKWVTANEDFTKYRKNQNVHVSINIGENKALNKFYPTKEWQENAIRDFIEFRNFLKNSEQGCPVPCSQQTPFKPDEIESKIRTSAPKYSQLIRCPQAVKIKLLQNISEYLNSDGGVFCINDNLGASIYGLLGLLQKPLTPDCCFQLRQLAKICANIRAELTESDSEAAAIPLNLFICIISNYYNQLDLADN